MRQLFWAALLLVGCGGRPEATYVSIEEALKGKLNGKQIQVTGYPALPSMTMISDTMLIDLWEQPDKKGKSIAFSLKVGVGPNCVERPPKDWKPSDLRIHGDDGALLGVDDEVEVNGQLLSSTFKGQISNVIVDPLFVFKRLPPAHH